MGEHADDIAAAHRNYRPGDLRDLQPGHRRLQPNPFRVLVDETLTMMNSGESNERRR